MRNTLVRSSLARTHARTHAFCKLILLALALSPSVGCGELGEDVSAQTESPIVGGQPTNEFPSVGNLFLDLLSDCTAELVAPGVVLLAAHCVALYINCEPRLNSTAFFKFPGAPPSGLTSPPRIYAPGLEPKQAAMLVDGKGLTYDASTGKCSGVPSAYYYDRHRDQDFALVAISPPITNISPLLEPWDVLPVNVPAAVPATWVGRTGGNTTLKSAGPVSQTSSLEVCDYVTEDPTVRVLQTDAPFFFADITSAEGVGATQRGDSGGALLVGGTGAWKIAGVVDNFFPKPIPKTGKPAECPKDPDAAEPGYNVWASLVSHRKAYDDFLECGKNDFDCDGLKNAEDNCKDTPNPSQDNWNPEVEQKLGSPEMGNACDPSPVGRSILNGEEALVFGPLSGSCNASTLPPYTACNARALSYELDVSTVWNVQQEVKPPITARTGFRYCICRDAAGDPILDKKACTFAWNCQYDHDLFPLPGGFGENETRFLRMTVYQGKQKLGGGTPTPWNKDDGEPVTYEAGLVPLARFATWNWPADVDGWKAAGFWWDLPQDGYPPAPDIPGILWTHNDSTLGSAAHGGPSTCFGVVGGCGYGDSYTFAWPARKTSACPIVPDYKDIVGSSAGPAGATESALSASSTSGGPDLPPCTEYGQKHCAPIPPRWLQARQHVISVPLLSEVTNDVNDPQTQKMALAHGLLETSFAAPCGSSEVARISVKQPPLVLRGVFSESLKSALLHPNGLTWLLPSEPPEIYRRSTFPAAVAVDGSGAVSATMVVDPDGHLALGSQMPAGASMGGLALGDSGPSAYSRVRGTVYQVLSSTLAGSFDTLRIRSLSGSVQDRPLISAQALAAVGKAAVFTERDRRLWLIGTSKASGAPSSLYVMDTDTGMVESVRQFVSGLERFWITTGADNGVALIAAPDAEPWYRVVLFEPETNVTRGRPRTAGVVQRQAWPLGTLRIDGGAVLVPETGPGPLKSASKPPKLETIAVEFGVLRASKGGRVFVDEQ